jgi:hypothetical protein
MQRMIITEYLSFLCSKAWVGCLIFHLRIPQFDSCLILQTQKIHIQLAVQYRTSFTVYMSYKYLTSYVSLTISLIFVSTSIEFEMKEPIVLQMPVHVDDAGPCGYVSRKL